MHPRKAVLVVLLCLSSLAWTQTAPLVPPTTSFDIARYLNVQSAGGPSYSPVSDEFVYLTNVSGTNQVWKGDFKSCPQQLTFYEDRVQFVRWSPRGDVILFGKDQGGDERSQLFLMDPSGRNIVALTNNPKAIHQFGGFSRDGTTITFSANERVPRLFDVYVMDLATRQARRIYQTEGTSMYARSLSPDKKFVLAAKEVSNTENDLYLIEVATGQATLLTPHSGEASYGDLEWLPDGSGFYLSSNQDRDKFSLAFYDLAKKQLRYLEDENTELDTISMDLAGNRLAYTRNENGFSALKLRDLKTGKVTELAKLTPPGIIGRMSFNGDGSKALFTFNSSTNNGNVWLWDLKSNQAAQVTRATTAGIPRESFVAPQDITYASFDGLKVPAFFYLPNKAAKDGKMPVIVSVHGGPEGQERPGFNPVYQYLLNRGYAVLAPNIRGSSGYGKKYIHMDDYKKRMDSIKDVAAIVDYLKTTGYADPKKIVVMGGSYGGYMTLAQVTMNPDLWAAGVDIVGIANWETYFKNTGPWRREHRAHEYGDPAKDPEFMRSISPIHYVDNIKAPLFVIAGANDPRVPKDEADQIVAKVKAKGVPVEYIAFPDEGHGLAKRSNRIRGYTAIADFLDKHVKGAQ